jgi:Berberine and berberine like
MLPLPIASLTWAADTASGKLLSSRVATSTSARQPGHHARTVRARRTIILVSVSTVILVVLTATTRSNSPIISPDHFTQAIPDELVIQGGAFTLPDQTQIFAVAGCYCGDLSGAEKILEPLRKFGSPMADAFNVMSYVQLQSMFDPFFPPGRQTYVKSNFIRNLNGDAIEAIAAFAGKSPSPFTFAPFIEHWHGAVTRVGVTDTAFPHRNHSYNLMFWSNWENTSDTEKNIQWTRSCWKALGPFLVEGSYSNYLSDEGDAVSRAAYGPNYDRLVSLKNKYDPTNLFRMNQNIKPKT